MNNYGKMQFTMNTHMPMVYSQWSKTWGPPTTILKIVKIVAEEAAVIGTVVKTAPWKYKLEVLNIYTLLSNMFSLAVCDDSVP